MIRNKSNIFSVDRGKLNGKLLQQCATCIDAVFRPFLVDTSINRKNIRFISSTLHYIIFDKSKADQCKSSFCVNVKILKNNAASIKIHCQ